MSDVNMESCMHAVLDDSLTISVTSFILTKARISMTTRQVRRRDLRFRINISTTVGSKEVSCSRIILTFVMKK